MSGFAGGSSTLALSVKDSVRAATTADITLSGLQTIDAVSLVAGNRVLVKDQAVPSENGIYVASTTSWNRSTDASNGTVLSANTFMWVEEGTVNGDNGFVLVTDDPVTVGTTALSFTQYTGAGLITAGDGLTKSGSTIDAVANADGSIIANADDLQVGVLATDAQHGTRGGGTQHADATASADGFATATQITKLDGIEALADVTDATNVAAALPSVGDVGIGTAAVAGAQLTLPQEDDAVTPTFAFGDGNTGFYERVDNDLRVSVGGVNTFLWFTDQFRSANGLGPAMRNVAATNVVPTLVPDISDVDTGIGQTAEDQLSLIAGGVEGHRITEVAGAITHTLTGDVAVTGTVDGRDVATDGTKLDGIEALAKDDQTITAGAGMTGGGTGDVTLDVVANADASIVVNANDVQVGVLASDAQHGVRGGGTQHADVVAAGADGFMTGTDKTKLDGIEALAAADQTITAGAGMTGGGTGDVTLNVIANADASMVVNADDIQVGVLATDAQHGVRGGGTQHADVIAAGASGFMTGADKTKLDGIATGAIANVVEDTTPQLGGNLETPDGVVINAANGGGTLDLRNAGVNGAVALSPDTVNFLTGWLYAEGNLANIGFGLPTSGSENAADIEIFANAITLRTETTGGAFATRIGILEDRIGFFSATPVVKPIATSDIKDSLVALGLITGGGATPLDLDAGTLTAGVGTFTGDVFSTAWTTFGGSSTIVGWVTPLANSTLINYKKVGNIVFIQFYLDGVSNATTVTFTLPFTQISTNGVELKVAIQVGDNNVISTTAGLLVLPSNSATATCNLDMAGAPWTASGNKRVQGQFWYEAQ